MVSISSGLKIGSILLAVGLGYIALKNAGKIGQYLGSTVGGGIAGGLNSLGSAFSNAFASIGPNETEGTQTLQGIIAQEGLSEEVANVPTEAIPVPLTPLEKGRLTLAGFLDTNRIAGTIDIQTGVFRNQYTTQDLDFVIDPNTGVIRTGTEGLAPATLQAQRELSARYGIPTFDVKGNLSTFGGFTSSR